MNGSYWRMGGTTLRLVLGDNVEVIYDLFKGKEHLRNSTRFVSRVLFATLDR
jgi:hypothetical protein